MEPHKSYGQFCGLARALDHIGDRWTLLVVRELLIGPKSHKALRQALPGVSPNLLVQRIRSLVSDGLVARNDAPTRSRQVTYRLTEAGQGLEPAILELIRWGGRWMTTGPGDDHVEPAWVVLAARALLDGAESDAYAGSVHVHADGEWLTLTARGGRLHAQAGRNGTAVATVSLGFPALLAVASGHQRLSQVRGVAIQGDQRLATRALQARIKPKDQ